MRGPAEFCDQLVEGITGAVTKAGLGVIGRSSAVALTAKGMSAGEIARQLHVANVYRACLRRRTPVKNASAEKLFARAIAIDSSFATAHLCDGLLLLQELRNDEALAAIHRARAFEPASLVINTAVEDLRQRHPLDVAGDLTAAHVRALARAGERVKLVVTGAGRELLEEVHWGLTPEEQPRVFWDFAWIWGPPEDHFAHLLRSVGAERFVYGTHWPLRLVQNPRANLDLLPEDLRATVISDARSLER